MTKLWIVQTEHGNNEDVWLLDEGFLEDIGVDPSGCTKEDFADLIIPGKGCVSGLVSVQVVEGQCDLHGLPIGRQLRATYGLSIDID